MKIRPLVPAFTLLLSPVLVAQVPTTFTQAVSNDWFASGNWSSGVPQNGYTASIFSGRTAIINGASASAYDIEIGSGGTDGTLQITGGANLTLQDDGRIALGYSGNGTGTLAVTSGTVSTNYDLEIGYATGSHGVLTLTGAGSSLIGASTGNKLTNVHVGNGTNSRGSLILDDHAQGSSYGLSIGQNTGSSGEMKLLNGSSWTTASQFFIGVEGTGSLEVSGGSHLVTATNTSLAQNSTTIGYGGGSGSMLVTGAGTTWTSPSYVSVGSYPGTGSLTISDGATVNVSYIDIGMASQGTAVVTGTGSSLTTQGIRIGGPTFDPNGSLTIKDGAQLNVQTTDPVPVPMDIQIYDNGSLTIGGAGATSGTVTASVITLSSATANLVFNHSDDLAFTVPISSVEPGNGRLTKAGSGVLTLSNSSAFSGATTVSGGTLKLGSADALSGSVVTLAGGTLDLNGFAATLGGLTGSSNFDFGPGTLTIGGGSDSTYSGILSGGALVKSGAGTFTLSNTNTYSGGTTVSAGLVAFSSAGNFGSGSVTLNGGGLRWATGNTLDITADPKFVLTAKTTSFDTNSNHVTLSGATTVLTGLRKLGAGTLTLANPNLYTGTTTISGGTLALAGPLPAGNLSLNGGVLATSGTISRAFGIGAAQFSTGTNGGGFAAYGGALTVTTGTATWGAGSFGTGALMLGSPSADNVVTWTSNISLGSSSRTINVVDNPLSTADYAQINGVISSTNTNGRLTKTGDGALVLAGANIYTGTTTVSGGTLALSGSGAISTANLVLNGGVLARSGSLGRTFGNNSSQFSLSGNAGGGFAAYGGALTVAPGTATWGTSTGFFTGGATGALILGSSIANNVVTWTSNIALGSGARTITVSDNPASTADHAVISGALSGSGSITKNGGGLLVLSAANTYSGATTVSAGTLRVNNTLASSGVTVASGATLGGSGTVGAVSLNGAISPGGDSNLPGTLATGAQTWNAGGSYQWELSDATGAAGTGYDLLSINGGLTNNASAGNRFTISVTSLSGTSPGSAANFNPALDQQWTIATATSVWIFDSDQYTIDTTGFTNPVGANARWSVTQVGNNLQLNFTAVPEPRHSAIAFAALLAGLIALRRRAARDE